jgi:hypothetical protein
MILPENATKGDAISHLSRSIPKTELGLPTYFYRSDLLPYPLNSMRTGDADPAIVLLSYDEGYPTLPNGSIFWYQLPSEDFASHLLFTRYLEQAAELGLRQLQLLAMDQNMPLGKLMELKKEFYWADRARAWDIFQVAAERRKRELRARQTEDTHYTQAKALCDQLLSKFADDPEWVSKVTHEDAMKMMIDLMKVQRISLGLSATGSTKDLTTDPYLAADNGQLMQEVTRGLQQANVGPGMSNNLQALLMDPQFAQMAQGLVFKIRRNDVVEPNDIINVTPTNKQAKPDKPVEDDM